MARVEGDLSEKGPHEGGKETREAHSSRNIHLVFQGTCK